MQQTHMPNENFHVWQSQSGTSNMPPPHLDSRLKRAGVLLALGRGHQVLVLLVESRDVHLLLLDLIVPLRESNGDAVAGHGEGTSKIH